MEKETSRNDQHVLSDQPLNLERSLGLTSLSNVSFVSSYHSGEIAYACGGVTVIYDAVKNKQTHFFKSRIVSCISYSKDDKYLAIGERGPTPVIQIWEIASEKIVATLCGHKHGVGCITFSPDNKYLVSVGFKQDRQLITWDWQATKPERVSTNKLGNKVKSIIFSPDGDYFITCGDRHLKWWYLNENSLNSQYDDPTSGSSRVDVVGKPASILEALQDAVFTDVCIGSGVAHGYVYCSTSSGALCIFHDNRIMDRWVQLDSPVAFCISMFTPEEVSNPSKNAQQQAFLIIGCGNGTIHLLDPLTLTYRATLPTPLRLPTATGVISDSFESPRASRESEESTDPAALYPACYALRFLSNQISTGGSSLSSPLRVAAVYADKSLFVWEVNTVAEKASSHAVYNFAKYRSFVNHRACVWDLQFLPSPETANGNASGTGSGDSQDGSSTSSRRKKNVFPAGTFVTCSADNTVRFWNTDPILQRLSLWRSTYSRDLLHTIHLDVPRAQITAVSPTQAEHIGGSPRVAQIAHVGSSGETFIYSPLHRASIGGPDALNNASGTSDESDSELPWAALSFKLPDTEMPDHPTSTCAPRALAIHPNRNEIACGDKTGRLRVFRLSDMEQVRCINAHNAEVLTMQYSPILNLAAVVASGERPQILLASAGRDRLVHVFDATAEVSMSVSAAARANRSSAEAGQTSTVAGGGPGSGYNEKIKKTKTKVYPPVCTLDNHTSSVTALRFSTDGSRLITCGGDKTVVFSSLTGTTVSKMRSVQTPHGTVTGLAVDATNKFAVTSGQDKRVNIWNVQTGKHVRAYRHDSWGELYKCDIDPSGMYIATSGIDKVIRILDFFSGEVVAEVSGHSELITGLRFSPDGRNLLTVSGDGCILQWRLGETLQAAMRDRLLELYAIAQRKQSKAIVALNALATVSVTAASTTPPTPPILPSSEKSFAQPLPPTPPSTYMEYEGRRGDARESAEQRKSKNRWAERIEKEGGEYELFGKKVAASVDADVRAKQRNQFTLELGDTAASTMAPLNTGLSSPGPSPSSNYTRVLASPRLASTVEAGDEVMLGDNDDEHALPLDDESEKELSRNKADEFNFPLALGDVGKSEEQGVDSVNNSSSSSVDRSYYDDAFEEDEGNVPGRSSVCSNIVVSSSAIGVNTNVQNDSVGERERAVDIGDARTTSDSDSGGEHEMLSEDFAVGVRLQRASSQIESLALSASRLEDWLERKLLEDTSLDTSALSTSMRMSISVKDNLKKNTSVLSQDESDDHAPESSSESENFLMRSISTAFFRDKWNTEAAGGAPGALLPDCDYNDAEPFEAGSGQLRMSTDSTSDSDNLDLIDVAHGTTLGIVQDGVSVFHTNAATMADMRQRLLAMGISEANGVPHSSKGSVHDDIDGDSQEDLSKLIGSTEYLDFDDKNSKSRNEGDDGYCPADQFTSTRQSTCSDTESENEQDFFEKDPCRVSPVLTNKPAVSEAEIVASSISEETFLKKFSFPSEQTMLEALSAEANYPDDAPDQARQPQLPLSQNLTNAEIISKKVKDAQDVLTDLAHVTKKAVAAFSELNKLRSSLTTAVLENQQIQSISVDCNSTSFGDPNASYVSDQCNMGDYNIDISSSVSSILSLLAPPATCASPRQPQSQSLTSALVEKNGIRSRNEESVHAIDAILSDLRSSLASLASIVSINIPPTKLNVYRTDSETQETGTLPVKSSYNAKTEEVPVSTSTELASDPRPDMSTSPDVSQILDKYSDRLAEMVSAKVMKKLVGSSTPLT